MFKIEKLDNKWWVPHQDKQNGNSTYALAFMVQVLNRYRTFPNDVSLYFMKSDGSFSNDLLFADDLTGKAIHFNLVENVDRGRDVIRFDLVDVSKMPKDAKQMDIIEIGTQIRWLVEDMNGNIQFHSDCVELSPEIYEDEQYVNKDLAHWAEYHDGYILDGDQASVYSNNELFHIDHQPDTVHWSEWNSEYVDSEDDYVCYGCTNDSGYEDYFYNEDYIYCEDTDRHYASSDIAWNVDEVYWSENLHAWTNKKADNAGYQSLSRKFKMTPNTTFGVGFEVEKEDYNMMTKYQYQDIHNQYGWCKENDSSLDDDDGFELVSPAFDLYTDDLDKEIESSKALQEMINAGHSTNCGGHITVSSSLYSAHEMLEGLSAFFPLLYALYDGRTDGDYSKPKEKYRYHQHPSKDAIMSRGNRTVYEADSKTFGAIELRIFSAVRNVKNLLWRRDLVRIMTDNFGKSEKEVLRLLINPKSKLFRHLLKVYDVQRIVNKITLFASFSKQYNFKIVELPDQNELLKKFRKALDNDSTNELGA